MAGVAILAHGRGYVPVGDHALTELQVRDVGRHPVVHGLYSRDGWSHPGPMDFYLLAPLYRLAGSRSLALDLGALLVNGVAIVGMALVARRRGGTPLLLCSLAGIVLLVRTLGIAFLADPWNPFVTVLPFGLLVFLVWAMACGETWALPASAVTASFLAQTHVGFVVLALPLVAAGAVPLVVRARRGDLVKAAATTALVVLVLWAPVFADAVNGPPDNVARVIDWFRDGDGGTHSALQGTRMLFGQLGGRPEWLVGHRAPLDVSGEPAFLYRAPVPWLLALVGVAAVVFRRLRATDGVRFVAVFGVSFVLGVVAIARTVGLVFDYRVRWTWIVGMLALVAVSWAAWLLAARWRAAAHGVLVAIAVGVVAVASIVNVVVAVDAEPPRAADSAVMEALLPGVLAEVRDVRGAVVVDDGPYSTSSDYSRSLLLQLERRGVDARMLPKDRDVVGDHRVVLHGRAARRLVVAQDDEIAVRDQEPGLLRVARWTSVTDAQERAFRRTAALLDRQVERGEIDPVERALRLKEIGLAIHDDAVAWAVAVYVDER